MKEKNFISAVVYVHNCEHEIKAFLKTVYGELEKHFEKFEIICVNDASCDKSRDRIKEVVCDMADTMVTILDMSYYQGLELAMRAGVDLSIGDFIYEFDSTQIDYAVELIFQVYKQAVEGYDICSASADRAEKRMSHVFYRIFNCFAVYDYKIQTESFRIISRRTVNRVEAMNQTIPYRKAIYANCGLNSCCVKYIPTKKGENVKSDREERKYRRRLAVDSLLLFTTAGTVMATALTMIMMIITVISGIYATVIFVTGNPVEGWTTIMLFLSFAFFGLFAILTVVTKYLTMILELQFKKQEYRFSGMEKITR